MGMYIIFCVCVFNFARSFFIASIPVDELCYTTLGHSCVFPFKFEGSKYNHCIKGNTSKFWCPYEITAELTSTKWDWCKKVNCSEHTDHNAVDFLNSTSKEGMISSIK